MLSLEQPERRPTGEEVHGYNEDVRMFEGEKDLLWRPLKEDKKRYTEMWLK